jgi:hypothetical protein
MTFRKCRFLFSEKCRPHYFQDLSSTSIGVHMYRVTSSIHRDYIEFFIGKKNSHKFSGNVLIKLEIDAVTSIHAIESSLIYV